MQNRIMDCRLALGMTQAELGKKIGLMDNTIARYENGTRVPSLEVWEDLASALHVSPAYLVGWSDEPSEDEHKHNIESSDAFKAYMKKVEPKIYCDFADSKPTSGVKVTLDDGRVIYASLEMDDIMNAYILAGDWVCLNGCKIAKNHIVSIEKVGAES